MPPLPPAGLRRQQLLGLATAAADWATGEHLPAPLLCSLTPQGDVALSLLRQGPAPDAAQQPAAVPLLLPATLSAGGDGRRGEAGVGGGAAAAMDGQLLPYVKGVPRAVVAAVAAGELQ